MEELREIIYKFETDLLKPEIRNSKEKLDEFIAPDFIEYGSSGFVYDKKNILERLPNEDSPVYTLSDFEIFTLSENIVQTRFKTDRVDKDGSTTSSLRSSLWKKENNKWRMFFHQGTVIK